MLNKLLNGIVDLKEVNAFKFQFNSFLLLFNFHTLNLIIGILNICVTLFLKLNNKFPNFFYPQFSICIFFICLYFYYLNYYYQLSHEELWDDSLLIEQYDETMDQARKLLASRLDSASSVTDSDCSNSHRTELVNGFSYGNLHSSGFKKKKKKGRKKNEVKFKFIFVLYDYFFCLFIPIYKILFFYKWITQIL